MSFSEFRVERLKNAIDDFLLAAEKPTGKITFPLQGTPEIERAIKSLYDAVERNP